MRQDIIDDNITDNHFQKEKREKHLVKMMKWWNEENVNAKDFEILKKK